MALGLNDPLRKELNERARVLRAELETLDREIEALHTQRSGKIDLLDHIVALLGAPQSALPDAVHGVQPVSSDESIADMVVALLRELGTPLHYRDIYETLSKAGKVEMAGKDPANSLLARYFRDERLYRPARGTYALRTSNRAVSVGGRTATQRKSRTRRSR